MFHLTHRLLPHYSKTISIQSYVQQSPQTAVAALSKKYRKHIHDLNEVDEEIIRQQNIEYVTRLLPKAVEHLRKNEAWLDEVLYLDILYTTPLNAEKRVLLRKKVVKLIEESQMPEEAAEDLIDFLKERGTY
jgi:hypothetical protein